MQPIFIPASPGALFALFFPPPETTFKRAIIHIPAFAEEMHKARRMVNLQARQFAQQGYAVLLPDLFGTGDSAGDFGAASWDIWLDNLTAVIDWLQARGTESIDFWGLRSGCLLALAYAAREPQIRRNWLLWQPVLNGESFVTRFLRLRVAAGVMANQNPPETTAGLKQQLLEGVSLEVAGYSLNPALIQPMLALQAGPLPVAAVAELAIFEVVSAPEQPGSAAAAQWLAELQAL